MTSLSRTLSLQISRHHGIVTDAHLAADGVERHSRRRLVTGGLLIAVHQGVYRVATSPDTFESRCVAACDADPTTVITAVAGARLWEFRHVFRTERPTVLVAHDRTPITRGVLLRRTNRLEPHEIVDARMEFGSQVRRECGSTVLATSTTCISSASPNGSSIATQPCRRSGVKPERSPNAADPAWLA